MTGSRFIDVDKKIVAFFAAAPSGASPGWVSLSNYNAVQIMLAWKNAASGATGTAVTVNQGKSSSGANSKALAIDTVWVSNDTTNSVALTQTAVTNNTFTTDNTASHTGVAFLEIRADRLDVANGFNYLQVGLGNATNSTVHAVYTLGQYPRFSGGFNSMSDPTT